MSLPAQNPAQQVAAVAGQTVIPFAWRCDDSALVAVYVNDNLIGGSAIALNADQTAAPGGTVTLVTPSAAGDVVTVERVSPQTQTVALAKYGPFTATVLNLALDKIIMLAQEASAILGKSVRAARSSLSKFSSLELPLPLDGQALAFTADAANPGKYKFKTLSIEAYTAQLLGGFPAVQPLSWAAVADGVAQNYNIAGALVSSADLYIVTIDGVPQEPTTDYTINLATVPPRIQFAVVPALNARIFARSFGYAKAASIGDATLVLASGGTTSRTLAAMSADIRNVKSYGAKGDGVTDDSVAIQAAINAATTGVVVLPPGTYKTTVKLSLPVIANGGFTLWLLDGAVISYTGASYAIEANGTGQSYANLCIRGGRVVGSAAGLAGLHLVAFNRMRIEGTTFEGFTTGDGIFNEGANTITLVDVQLKANKNGLHNVGKVVLAVNYSPNAVVMLGGHVAFNTQWGYWSDGALSATVGPNLANSFHGVTFEFNGAAGAGGHVFLQASDTEGFIGSYFEYGGATFGTSSFTLGDATYTAKNTSIAHNWIGSAGATNSINLVRALYPFIVGNNETSACANFVNAAAASGGIVLGTNIAQAVGTYAAGNAGSYNIKWSTSLATLSIAGGVGPGNSAGSTQAGFIYMGSGAPNNANGANGDVYHRTDTPGVANQRIYVKSAGAWVGIL